MNETQNVADELILYAWEQHIRCRIMVSETNDTASRGCQVNFMNVLYYLVYQIWELVFVTYNQICSKQFLEPVWC